MYQRPLLLKLLLILVVCILIFAGKIFYAKNDLVETIPTDNFVPTTSTPSSIPATEKNKGVSADSAVGSTVKIGDATVKITVADTPAERERGLSGHPGLHEDEGLLFVFEIPGKYGFWMKDMLFSIDIIWLNENREVIYIKKNATPESFPEVFTPPVDAKYVLEVVAGLTDEKNISVGNAMEF
jgi:uncharacterized membrane protein (UPF0127 family)